MNDRLEEQLRSALNRQAEARPAAGPDLADVFGRARSIRRRRTAIAAGVAAAAVLAVVIPTAVVLGGQDGSDHGIAPATSSPTPSAPSTPSSTASETTATDPSTAPGSLGIGGISIGSHTQWTYLDPQQQLHGGSAAIPAALLKHGGVPLDAFMPYHGGWLLSYDSGLTILEADNTGKIIAQGEGGAMVSTSDGMQTAFQIGSTVHAGIASGMGESEATWQLRRSDYLVGYLDDGPVVSSGDHGYAILTPDGGRTPVDSEITARAASSAAGLVGGVTGTVEHNNLEGAVVDAATGAILWHNQWRPVAFSPDGKYVAAYPVRDNGDAEAYAILDARTGAVLAQTPSSVAGKVYLGGSVVWDTDDSIVFTGLEAQAPRREALLTLKVDGTFDQASEPMKQTLIPGVGEIGFVLMSR
jgi:hypothetical protein